MSHSQENPRNSCCSFRAKANKRRWLLILPVLLLAVLGFLIADSWTLTPPPPPRQPAVVFVGDYGHHARLAMQLPDGTIIEYAFGDWRYYARQERSVWRGARALLTPSDATLGRRLLPFVPDEAAFTKISGARRSVRIEVEPEALETLIARLDQRYRTNLGSEIRPGNIGLAFVHEERNYHLFRNSNHQVAQWLQELGCEVRGFPILSNFRVSGRPEVSFQP